MNSLRSSKKFRLVVIIILALVAIFVVVTSKVTWIKVLAGTMLALLLAAFGMEVSNTDYDLGKVIETKSFEKSKIQRDESGNLTNVDAFCNAKESDYNCDDFVTQGEAVSVYNRCKSLGKNMDIYGLDRDKDGQVCESLPKNKK